MKKLLIVIAAVTLVISVSSATAFAAGGGRGRHFVDNDGDGIWDNFTAGTSQNGSGFRRGHCGGHGRCGR